MVKGMRAMKDGEFSPLRPHGSTKGMRKDANLFKSNLIL